MQWRCQNCLIILGIHLTKSIILKILKGELFIEVNLIFTPLCIVSECILQSKVIFRNWLYFKHSWNKRKWAPCLCVWKHGVRKHCKQNLLYQIQFLFLLVVSWFGVYCYCWRLWFWVNMRSARNLKFIFQIICTSLHIGVNFNVEINKAEKTQANSKMAQNMNWALS